MLVALEARLELLACGVSAPMATAPPAKRRIATAGRMRCFLALPLPPPFP
jgi:hypothetical protein